MSGVKWNAVSNQISTGGSSRRTLMQITAAANHRSMVKEVSISFEGVSNTDPPLEVTFEYQGDAGTGGQALTVSKGNPSDDETIQTTGLQGAWATTEPASGDDIRREFVHPQGGFSWQAPFGQEIPIPGGSRFGVYVNTSLTLDAVVTINGEE